ncbi:Succinate--hydroxymethylglutarate CoA-transferase [Colletotrichum siamense]|uniref:Succinate--hydroxymethylglutarate CoA-transferase n=1 Tax=Colletotrichum siamense TaxID=690259 RepID=A0A9P5F4M3_COLSI|nr:Succinate--hydroxymethylglutarate CoA-transferase [Colletotrichum siamense]KAI8159658.1 Succinate--hydroxymethylglutarate CoA-transferase [Colletotrichum sp. SAR 10_71]KAI8166392.1 Succinate--hydroxymethylglutarate CoA-transferase [Colletotrichum sp. SAR 10_70]KAI8171275.1 Succinate--hydroxymethylglutarate CoA-transferase [Colletotrichum sp. SAR 10_65]KAI8175225.1 Succinate--hydroxymethylglutarate CoA-transferase [Colletotrichum sp. SAR 10_75]KAI8203687.1 Succinate--hydroxymethylglutarate C
MTVEKIPDIYGPGTFTDKTFTSVPEDTERIFRLIASQTPGFTQDERILSKVQFTGESYPVIPGPIKATSVAAALHAMTGVLADEILTLRGAKNDERQITVNTTHAAIWFGCIATAFLDGVDVVSLVKQGKLKELLPDWERGWTDTPLKYRATGLYPTSDPEVWYSLHGSMNAEPVLRSIGVDPSTPAKTPEEAARLIAQHTSKLSPEKMEMTNLLNGFCGSICFTPKQWRESEMGRSLSRHPLVNVQKQEQAIPTPPVAFPPLDPNDKRPLAGVKVVEMTRVIAGPQIGTILAAYGADVIRVNPPHLPDINIMQLTLNAGKRTIAIDLRKDEDAAILKSLVSDCDVFIQGFRINKMPKFGLGLNDLLKMAGERGRGIVYVSENCFGPDGYYAERPGWQQIADAAAGSAYVTGKSLNLSNNEAVLPSLPISDMSTGVLGAVGAMLGLKRRAVEGGSYYSHASLTGVNAYALTEEVGLYPEATVEECKQRFQWGEMRGSHHVLDLLVTVWNGWQRVLGDYLQPESDWFQSFHDSAFDKKRLSILKPVVKFKGEQDTTPEWKTPSVPYANERAETVKFL